MMRSSFIAITLHFYIASVSCLPFFLKSVFGNGGCTSAIHQELDIEQGLQPDLHTLKKFGKAAEKFTCLTLKCLV